MKFLLTSRRGETLIEVVVALMMLIVGALTALRLMGVASISNQLTKERVIATNLAREGIEAVRTIRDTNWLRYAGERRKCWNNNDSTGCDGNSTKLISHRQQYLAKFASNYRWSLSDSGLSARLDLTDGIDAADEEYRLKIDADDGLYNHENGANSIYFREIYTEYLNDTATAVIILGNPTESNVLRVTSRVEWYDRGQISEVTLTTILTDYLGRRNHD